MDITDPRVIKFVNECVRPLCEAIRDLKVKGDSALLTWSSQVQPLVPDDSSVLQDGRSSEGVSILTGADINAVMTLMQTLHVGLEANPTNAVTISKPCVRQI
jgi:hypothetical protein